MGTVLIDPRAFHAFQEDQSLERTDSIVDMNAEMDELDDDSDIDNFSQISDTILLCIKKPTIETKIEKAKTRTCVPGKSAVPKTVEITPELAEILCAKVQKETGKELDLLQKSTRKYLSEVTKTKSEIALVWPAKYWDNSRKVRSSRIQRKEEAVSAAEFF